jgi:hypothetical protein
MNVSQLTELSLESESYSTINGQSASLPWNKAPIWDLRPNLYYRQTVVVLLMWGALSGESWASPAQSFSGPGPVGLATIFYSLRFETSLLVASYDSQGYGGGIRPCLHAV